MRLVTRKMEDDIDNSNRGRRNDRNWKLDAESDKMEMERGRKKQRKA